MTIEHRLLDWRFQPNQNMWGCGIRRGWVCPKCGAVLAPYIPWAVEILASKFAELDDTEVNP